MVRSACIQLIKRHGQSPALQVSQPPQLPFPMAKSSAHKSLKAEYAAYFAMKETNGDYKAAEVLYNNWVPEEPVSKWRPFAKKKWEKYRRPETELSRNLGGREPRVSRELALKIGTVYAQRLVWEHGQSRHYHDMEEVRDMQLLAPVPNPDP